MSGDYVCRREPRRARLSGCGIGRLGLLQLQSRRAEVHLGRGQAARGMRGVPISGAKKDQVWTQFYRLLDR